MGAWLCEKPGGGGECEYDLYMLYTALKELIKTYRTAKMMDAWREM